MRAGDARIKLAGLPVALTSKTFRQFVIIAVVLGFTAVLAAGAAAGFAVHRDQALTRAVAHSNAVQKELANFRILLERAETARRGYLLSRDSSFTDTYSGAIRDLPASVDRVLELTRDNPEQQPRLQEIRRLLTTHLAVSLQSIELVRQGGQAAAIREFVADRAAGRLNRMRQLASQVLSEEERLLALRQTLQEHSVGNLYLALGVAAPLLILVALGSTFVIFRYTRDLAATSDTLRAMNEGLEDAVADRTAGLARANDEIQRFAYIVSHDLRSPLVNVMGFTAELETTLKPLSALIDRVEQDAPALASKEAAVAVREDVPEAIGFIRASTQKMDRLINAILALSRNGRRTLKPEPLDMDRVLAEVAATLKTRADEAGATVTLAGQLPKIVSDRLAIEQVFANLIENAIKYAAPGRPGLIEVIGEERGGRAVFEVRDNGRGIDPKDHERIFELFRRSGAQDRPGEGIGLANVRALVYRLRGSIEVDSALDRGTTFRVLLPAILKVDQETSA